MTRPARKTYPLSATANNTLDRPRLDEEIKASGNPTLVANYLYLTFEALSETIVVYTTSALTGGETSTLDAVVAAHDGTNPASDTEQLPYDNTGTDLTANNVQDALTELDDEKQAVSEKDQAGGYIGLDGSNNINVGGNVTVGGLVDGRDVAADGAKLDNYPSTPSAIDHGSLSGLSDDDHPQYQLRSEKGVANGYASLDGGGKVPAAQLPSALSFQGTWNASTNTPTLTSGVGTAGDIYIVSVAGTTNLDGITDWGVGDWAAFSGTVWEKVDNTDQVTTVFGRTGAVTAQSGDYTATQVTDSSTVGGATVEASLTALDVQKQDLSEKDQASGYVGYDGSGDINPLGLVDGRDVAADGSKLDGIESGAQVNDVDSVFGRTGTVTAQSGDYAASQVVNDASGVTGSSVAAGLEDHETRIDTLESTPSTDEFVRVRAADTTPGFLFDKLNFTSAFLRGLDPATIGGDEQMLIAPALQQVALYAYSGSVLTFTGGPVNVPLDTEPFASDPTLYSRANDEVTVLQTGWYFIAWGASVRATSNGRTQAIALLQVNANTVAGQIRQLYARQSDYGASGSGATIVSMTAGSVVRLRLQRTAGSASLQQNVNEGSLLIIRIGGFP